MAHFFGESDIRRERREPGWKDWSGASVEGWEPDIYSASSYFDISLSADTSFQQAEKLLADMPGALEKAVRSAAKRTGDYLRTASAKAVRERYAIPDKAIREEETASVHYSFDNGAQVTILFSGYKIPLYRFSGASPLTPTKDTSRRVGVMLGSDYAGMGNFRDVWRSLYPSVAASGHVLKSTAPYRFEKAFVARMRSGHVGIWERTGGMTKRDKDEIEELYGPSVPQMLGNDTVADKLLDDARGKFDERLDHEVLRLLNGW